MGLTLIVLVLWGAYRSTLKAILFDSPASNGGSGSGGLNIWGVLNPLNDPLFNPIGAAKAAGLSAVTPSTAPPTYAFPPIAGSTIE